MHPLQRFFKSQRQRPTFEWERFQHRDVLVVDHPRCQAVFSRQGAQLLHFQPAGQKPWLWCSATWPQTGAIRGGVPVCWPWHGRHPSEGMWPAHGWGRLVDWKLQDSQEDEAGVSLHWRLSLCDWQVDLHARLGDAMELRLSTEHQDIEPCQLSHALLAYWRIGDISEISLAGFDGLDGYDKISRQPCRQDGDLQVSGACQRVFSGVGALQLEDRAWERRLAIDTDHNDETGVWHPGARPLLGVKNNESQGFVCVETVSGGDEYLTLAPGEKAHLSLQARLLS